MKVSASGLKLFRGCSRRWYFARVLARPEPETEATSLGQRIHTELEEWAKHGRVPDHPLAQKMLATFKGYPWWADPEVAEAEGGFEFSDGGVTFHGYTDFRREGSDTFHRIIGDYKTTSNLAYALRPGAGVLLDFEDKPDVQSALYAWREYLEGAKRVTGVWLYGLTRPPHTTRIVEAELEHEAIRPVMIAARRDGRAMLRLAKSGLEANEVAYNSGYCWAFKRPCPFIADCHRPTAGLFALPDPLDEAHHMTNDNIPPPPPDDDSPHLAENAARAAASRPATRDLAAEVESGFVNPPEAKGKAPFPNVEAARGKTKLDPIEIKNLIKDVLANPAPEWSRERYLEEALCEIGMIVLKHLDRRAA